MEAERARLFVALVLPEPAREALVRWRSGVLRDIPQLRPVVEDALHVTLCFLGSRPADEVEAIAAACETVLGGAVAPALGLETGLWLPPRRPRVLAVRLDDPSGALAGIQGAVASVLSDGGWYTPEKRPFLPHVTVARVPAKGRVRAVELPKLSQLPFTAPAVTLYRSRLHRSGARYEALASVPLSPQGRAT